MAEKTKSVNADFMKYALKRVWMATGASEEHADAVANALLIGMRQGKLNQGLGVYEAIDLAFQKGLLDIKAEPVIIKEGPTWAAYDGKKSSGYWTLTKMARTAIAKAKEHGIAIVFGSNHNDAGSYGSYTWLAYEEDCFALTSNNSVPMCSPLGGMGNTISVPPLDAIAPSGEEAPVWMSTKLCEWYDADTAQAVLQGTKLKGDYVIDPDTGELGNDLAPYAVPVPGYGRVYDQTCFQQLHEPRVYMLNLWNEVMTAILNPFGIITPEVASLTDILTDKAETTTVGGSYYLCIDLDALDPPYNSASSAVEPFGLDANWCWDVLKNARMSGKVNLVGADVVEYAPQNDPVKTFGYVAAGFSWKILCWMAADMAKRNGEARPTVWEQAYGSVTLG